MTPDALAAIAATSARHVEACAWLATAPDNALGRYRVLATRDDAAASLAADVPALLAHITTLTAERDAARADVAEARAERTALREQMQEQRASSRFVLTLLEFYDPDDEEQEAELNTACRELDALLSRDITAERDAAVADARAARTESSALFDALRGTLATPTLAAMQSLHRLGGCWLVSYDDDETSDPVTTIEYFDGARALAEKEGDSPVRWVAIDRYGHVCSPPTAERDAALSRATAAEARGAEVRAPIYARIEAERVSQDAKWGELNYPDVDRVLTDRKGSTRIDGAGVHRWPDGCDPERMAEEYGIPAEWRAKANCNGAAKLGQCTWAHIAVEEMAEAVHAATLAQQGRGPEEDVDAELVQLAAVVTAWIEARARRLDALAAKGGVR